MSFGMPLSRENTDEYQEQSSTTGLTALAGFPIYLDLAQAAGLRDTIGATSALAPKGPRAGPTVRLSWR